jgi:L-ascorbate metabolism protein UlaG (beta-lactamase superfamily)
MEIRKHEHAFLELSQKGQTLLVDPGLYSEVLPELKEVVGVVYTHLHDDHSFLPHAQQIVKLFPNAQLFGTAEVRVKFEGLAVTAVHHGDHHEVGNFQLDFFGDLHQEIHRSIPLVQNVGVLVNSTLYYPGDSYTICDYPVEVLACPSSAPWLRVGDLIDFLEIQKPKRAFPTHNALLSEAGHALQNNRIREFVEKHGGEFEYLTPGQSTKA